MTSDMNVGFIGTGAITSAIVTGLCTAEGGAGSIWVSPRNAEKALELKKRFDRVRIGRTNQEVLDNAEVVVLAFLPRQRQEILAPLTFREDQEVVNLLAGIPVSDIAGRVTPAKRVVRVIPLPCCAMHIGPIAVFPQNETVSRIFTPLGTVITVEKETQLEPLMVITGLMAPYYSLLETVVAWAETVGVDRRSASGYVSSMFGALSAMAGERADGDMGRLVTESMTPGGLNELAQNVVREKGGFAQIREALAAVQRQFGA